MTTEVLYRRKDAQKIFRSIPDGARIIIMPAVEQSAWFHEGNKDIQKAIKKIRKTHKPAQLKNDYSRFIVT